MNFATATITLFLVMDPLGNIPFFLSALRKVAPERQQRVLMRELVIAYGALIAFLLVGRPFLNVLHLRQESVSIAGGIILFLIALRMVFPHNGANRDEMEGEPFVVPLAIPGVAGPSALATVLLLANQQPGSLPMSAAAVTAAWLASSLVLVASPFFLRFLGERGLVAMERLMGMVLVAVAVQMFLDGLARFSQ
jgi:multiple antibiotic resistance protein